MRKTRCIHRWDVHRGWKYRYASDLCWSDAQLILLQQDLAARREALTPYPSHAQWSSVANRSFWTSEGYLDNDGFVMTSDPMPTPFVSGPELGPQQYGPTLWCHAVPPVAFAMTPLESRVTSTSPEEVTTGTISPWHGWQQIAGASSPDSQLGQLRHSGNDPVLYPAALSMFAEKGSHLTAGSPLCRRSEFCVGQEDVPLIKPADLAVSSQSKDYAVKSAHRVQKAKKKARASPSPTPAQPSRNCDSLHAPIAGANQEERDRFLVRAKNLGMAYKDIKVAGKFPEAISTLRGRFRTLTKTKEERVRQPKWEHADVSRSLRAKLLHKHEHGLTCVFPDPSSAVSCCHLCAEGFRSQARYAFGRRALAAHHQSAVVASSDVLGNSRK